MTRYKVMGFLCALSFLTYYDRFCIMRAQEQIQEDLGNGLAFLNDGSARYAFISTGGNVISSGNVGTIVGLGTPSVGSTFFIWARIE